MGENKNNWGTSGSAKWDNIADYKLAYATFIRIQKAPRTCFYPPFSLKEKKKLCII